MQVYAAVDPRLPLSAVPGYARRAEQVGFDGVHVAETIHDSLAVALLAAEHTTRITVRTAVTLAFVRSPTAVAYAAWDLAAISGGRFELGLGTQIKQNIEGRFGMAWSPPRARMAEYLDALHALFESFSTGRPPNVAGRHYRITRMQPYFNPGPIDVDAPAIWLGGVNPGMCELAGAQARGVIAHSTNSDPDYLREVVRPALARGAAAADRPSRPQLIASPAVAAGADDASVARERERQRRMLAFLYSTPAYAGTLERRGRPGTADRLREMIRDQRWEQLPTLIDDALLDDLVTVGRYDELPGLLETKYGQIADGIVLPPLAGPPDDDAMLRDSLSAWKAGT